MLVGLKFDDRSLQGNISYLLRQIVNQGNAQRVVIKGYMHLQARRGSSAELQKGSLLVLEKDNLTESGAIRVEEKHRLTNRPCT
jgi:hypothetical protein